MRPEVLDKEEALAVAVEAATAEGGDPSGAEWAVEATLEEAEVATDPESMHIMQFPD